MTYNVHKCRGLDRQVRPERIVEVLTELNADIIALQEVLSIRGKRREDDQARFIAEELGYDYQIGVNRRLNGGAYGNVTLSRLPMIFVQNYDLSHRGHEKRGCLHTDIQISPNTLLHVYNIHLGTAFIERRHQARRLLNSKILENSDVKGSRILLGDFNEWTRGLASRLLSAHFDGEDIRFHLRRSRTYPGLFPFLHLDHIYFDGSLVLEGASWHRTKRSLVASDHLPIAADFCLSNL